MNNEQNPGWQSIQKIHFTFEYGQPGTATRCKFRNLKLSICRKF